MYSLKRALQGMLRGSHSREMFQWINPSDGYKLVETRVPVVPASANIKHS